MIKINAGTRKVIIKSIFAFFMATLAGFILLRYEYGVLKNKEEPHNNLQKNVASETRGENGSPDKHAKKDQEIHIERLKPSKTNMYEVKIIVSSKYKKAQILVDGKGANVIKNTPTVKIISLAGKTDSYKIEVKSETGSCITRAIVNKNMNLVCDWNNPFAGG